MALIKCPGCGREISNKAKKCPQCGCPSSVWSGEGDSYKFDNVTIKKEDLLQDSLEKNDESKIVSDNQAEIQMQLLGDDYEDNSTFGDKSKDNMSAEDLQMQLLGDDYEKERISYSNNKGSSQNQSHNVGNMKYKLDDTSRNGSKKVVNELVGDISELQYENKVIDFISSNLGIFLAIIVGYTTGELGKMILWGVVGWIVGRIIDIAVYYRFEKNFVNRRFVVKQKKNLESIAQKITEKVEGVEAHVIQGGSAISITSKMFYYKLFMNFDNSFSLAIEDIDSLVKEKKYKPILFVGTKYKEIESIIQTVQVYCGVSEEKKEESVGKSAILLGKSLGEGVFSLFLIILAIIVLGSTVSTDAYYLIHPKDRYVQFVSESSPSNYPDLIVGNAFKAYFSKPKWSTFESEDGRRIVEFTGGCYYDGQPVDVVLQYTVDEENGTYMVTYLSYNGVSQNLFQAAALLDAVYSDYQ